MAVTASLGRWQLSRAAEKQALQSMLDARARLPALDATAFLGAAGTETAATAQTAAAEAPSPSPPAHEWLHRAVTLQGRWLGAHTVFLDNRQMQGRPGFFVLTPFQVEGRSDVVVVQRGWVPRNFQDRTQLPPVATPEGLVRLQGRVAAAPSRLYEFQGGGGAEGSSRIRQNLDLYAFRAETGLALASLTVLQTDSADSAGDGLQRDWPVVGAGVDKHYGYAFQWFGLCGLIALLYVWFQIVRRFIRPRSQPAP
ncbi:SURF1 family protein [Paracidovorax sp. MALMAid1276]|uniref:SURF1 family protein n=1 Tax=Paracidovorax sp. MALMAid1276 TaxID=3411631 RepID=UPI003B9C72C7